MDTRFPLIIGNWKMHKTVAETQEHVRRLVAMAFRVKVGIWLAVPYTDLAVASELAADSEVQIGAQNMSDLMAGALTGEISATMLLEAGATFVLLGHSERRKIFFEDDPMINRKVKLALRSGLKVVLCVGETKEERDEGRTQEVLKEQLSKGLEGVPPDALRRVVIAYEPVWAIGSRMPATPEVVEEIHDLCKNYLAKEWGLATEEIHVLYGGSVNGANAHQFLQVPLVDGLLVGGASLDVKSFMEIIHQAEGVKLKS